MDGVKKYLSIYLIHFVVVAENVILVLFDDDFLVELVFRFGVG